MCISTSEMGKNPPAEVRFGSGLCNYHNIGFNSYVCYVDFGSVLDRFGGTR